VPDHGERGMDSAEIDARSKQHRENMSGLRDMLDSFRVGYGGRRPEEPSRRFVEWLETRDRYETVIYAAERPDCIREATDP
jgi:hypothetical protein